MSEIQDALYERRQVGWLMIPLVALGLIAALGSVMAVGQDIPLWVFPVIGVIPLVVLVLFSSLRVRVTSRDVHWAFGPGWPKWRLALDEIESVEPVRYPWWYGYGIRLTPEGWLYNVWGRWAVRIRTTSGRIVRVGTDDPDGLAAAVQRARARRRR